MKTSELIIELQQSLEENGDLEVYSTSDYGDYHHTEQLNEIQQVVALQPKESGYAATGLAVPRKYDEGDEGDQPKVLVLRYI